VSQDDPHTTVQAFIDLILRHEQSFYNFVHKVHSKGEGLFDSLMHWIELFLTTVREGLGDPISLEFLLPHTGPERSSILTEVDKIATYHYKLKVAYEEKIRRRFGRAAASEADAEDEATQAIVNGVMGEINFGELVAGDAIDLAAEETDEEESSSDGSDSSEYETGSEDESDDTETSHRNAQPSRATNVAKSPGPARNHFHHHRPMMHTTNGSHPTLPNSTLPPSQSAHAPPTRKRSFSLKKAKSMTFSMSNLSSSSRQSQDVPPVPPVPSLPTASHTAFPAPSKPLPSPPPDTDSPPASPPPVPAKDRLSLASSSQRSLTTQTDKQPPKSPKYKPTSVLAAPDLEHIPKLLPIFVEMMKPSLRVRKVG
jgi:hypothetical protein